MFTAAEADACRRLLDLALQEDLGANGDLTSQAVIPADLPGRAALVARSAGVVAGLPAAQTDLRRRLIRNCRFRTLVPDGSAVSRRRRAGRGERPMRSILAGERTALNFLQRLSGVATPTARYVEAAAEPAVQGPGHAQDDAGLAAAGEVRGALRRRPQPPHGPLRRRSHQGQPPRRGRRRPDAVAEAVRLARRRRRRLPAGNRGGRS